MPHRKGHKLGLLGEGQQGLLPANAGFGEFQQETYRYGNPPPTLKLAMLKYPDAAHVVDMGTVSREPEYGWSIRGKAGHADAPDTFGEILQSLGDYDSPRDYYDTQKERGSIREGLSYKDWIKSFKPLAEDERYVAGVAQSYKPLRPDMWSHEFGHIGQMELRESGGGKEARQRMRDIMYPSLRHIEQMEDDLQYLEGQGYEIGDKDWMQLYENTKLEDEYANEQLRLMGKTPGGTPNLQVLEDWLEGGRTKEGYEEVIKKRRRENLPGFSGLWNKAKGLLDL